MTVGKVYRLPSGRLVECVAMNSDGALFRYLDAPSTKRGDHEFSLTSGNWRFLRQQ